MRKLLACSVGSALVLMVIMGCGKEVSEDVSMEPQAPAQVQGVQREVTLEAGQLRAEVGAQAPLPKVVEMPIPEYPPEASKNGVSGRVTVRALIEKDGSISQVIFYEGDPIFKDAACAAIQKARFSPGSQRLWVSIPLTFSLS